MGLIKKLQQISGGGGNEGTTAWEKGNYAPSKSYTLSFSGVSMTMESTDVLITPTGIDISEITPAVLVGKTICKMGVSSYVFTSETQVTYYYNSGSRAFNYTYNPATGIVVIQDQIYLSLEWIWQTVSGTIPESWELLNYVVSDDASEYPNGDYGSDGYYYKLLASV